jgi:hypothetical protein
MRKPSSCCVHPYEVFPTKDSDLVWDARLPSTTERSLFDSPQHWCLLVLDTVANLRARQLLTTGLLRSSPHPLSRVSTPKALGDITTTFGTNLECLSRM